VTILNNLIAEVLSFFYGLVPNYALSIIFLTLVVMIVVTPLTLKGTRSMMMMQQLQPEMKKLQTKYKDDRQKLNEELMKFYKENNINPLGGCLPLVVQAPIFIVLYQVLRGLTRRDPSAGMWAGFNVGQIGSDVTRTVAPNFSLQKPFDPAFLSPSSELWQALHGSNTMDAFGMDLSQSASQAMSKGIVTALPYLFLIVIVGVSGFVQQRQIQGRTPAQQQANQQMQTVMKIMPLFLPLISYTLPGGLVLYFVVSNLYRIGQQAFISKSIYGVSGLAFLMGFGSLEDSKGTKATDKKATGAKPSGRSSSSGAKGSAGAKVPAKSGAGAKRGASGSAKGSSTKSSPTTKSSPATKSGGSSSSSKPNRSSGATPKAKGPSPAAPASSAGSPLQPRARKPKKR
jgi:YidC/Oxa1 family membrane protein insertase